MSCPKCGGDGVYPDHSTGVYDHDEDGSCNGSCPVRVQCEVCCGTGEQNDQTQKA